MNASQCYVIRTLPLLVKIMCCHTFSFACLGEDYVLSHIFICQIEKNSVKSLKTKINTYVYKDAVVTTQRVQFASIRKTSL
jgi:hypothetical protein